MIVNYSFFDSAIDTPFRAEDFFTPKQRLNAIAKIVAIIALLSIQQDKEAEDRESTEER